MKVLTRISKILSTLVICFVFSGSAFAIEYKHTASTDAAAPTQVYGTCVSSYTGGTISNFPYINFSPDRYKVHCTLQRGGIQVAQQYLPIVQTEHTDVFENSRTLSAPRQNNCLYCTKNKGKFYSCPFINNISCVTWDVGDAKGCDSSGYGPGGGGGRGEP
jgi:hypothetical protein